MTQIRCCSCAHETLEWIRFGEVIKEVVDLSKARGRGGWTAFIRFYSGVQTPDMCVYLCRCKSSQHQTRKQDNNTTLTFSNLSWPGYISYVNCQPILAFGKWLDVASGDNYIVLFIHLKPSLLSQSNVRWLYFGESINHLAIVTCESCTTETPILPNLHQHTSYINVTSITW